MYAARSAADAAHPRNWTTAEAGSRSRSPPRSASANAPTIRDLNREVGRKNVAKVSGQSSPIIRSYAPRVERPDGRRLDFHQRLRVDPVGVGGAASSAGSAADIRTAARPSARPFDANSASLAFPSNSARTYAAAPSHGYGHGSLADLGLPTSANRGHSAPPVRNARGPMPPASTEAGLKFRCVCGGGAVADFRDCPMCKRPTLRNQMKTRYQREIMDPSTLSDTRNHSVFEVTESHLLDDARDPELMESSSHPTEGLGDSSAISEVPYGPDSEARHSPWVRGGGAGSLPLSDERELRPVATPHGPRAFAAPQAQKSRRLGSMLNEHGRPRAADVEAARGDFEECFGFSWPWDIQKADADAGTSGDALQLYHQSMLAMEAELKAVADAWYLPLPTEKPPPPEGGSTPADWERAEKTWVLYQLNCHVKRKVEKKLRANLLDGMEPFLDPGSASQASARQLEDQIKAVSRNIDVLRSQRQEPPARSQVPSASAEALHRDLITIHQEVQQPIGSAAGSSGDVARENHNSRAISVARLNDCQKSAHRLKLVSTYLDGVLPTLKNHEEALRLQEQQLGDELNDSIGSVGAWDVP